MAYQAIFSNIDYVVDVRELIARFEHLEQLRQPGPIDLGAFDNQQDQDSLFHELSTLEAMLDEMRGSSGDEQWRGDWYPITLIRDSYFKDYAQELAEDIGAIDHNASWPMTCIDWDQAARDLRMDYSSVDWDGVTYWYR